MPDIIHMLARRRARLADLSARARSATAEALARRRVALGFLVAAVTLLLAQPTWDSWRAGLLVAVAGEALRVWAAGHLEKAREVTRSGPYRWTAHPLYVGSAIVALGVVIASRSVVVAAVAFVYMGATVTAAIRTEEAFLRQRFGEAYDRDRRSGSESAARRFSLARVRRNREPRAVAGLAAGFGLLATKIALHL
ncbi:MAG: isoprenylcysteine carboxylmethyltransferase family protein [Acidobacteria bacterium]|nr:isoprenylcysteine carboxylmethyltransferase family protein [Acidobacteriota bacterium]